MGVKEETAQQKDNLLRRKAYFFKCCDKFFELYDEEDCDLVCDWDSFNSSAKQALRKFEEPPLSALNFLNFSIEQQTEFLFDFFAYCKIKLQIKPNNALKNVINLKYRPEEFWEYFRHPALLPAHTTLSDSEKELTGILEFCRFYRMIYCSPYPNLDYSPDDCYLILFPKSKDDLVSLGGLTPDLVDDIVAGNEANVRKYLIQQHTKDLFRKIAGIDFGTRDNQEKLLEQIDHELTQLQPVSSELNPEQEILLCYVGLDALLDILLVDDSQLAQRNAILQNLAPKVVSASQTTEEVPLMKMREFWGEYLILKSRLSTEKDVYESIMTLFENLSDSEQVDLYTHRPTYYEAYYAACPTGNIEDMKRCYKLFSVLSKHEHVQQSSLFSPAKWKILSHFLSEGAPSLKMPRDVQRNNTHLVRKRSGNQQEGTPRKRGDLQSYKANNMAKELIRAYESDPDQFDLTYDLSLLNIAMNAYAITIPLSTEEQSLLLDTYFYLMDKYCDLFLEASQASFLFKLTCLNHAVDMYISDPPLE